MTEFRHTLEKLTPRVWGSWVLAGANVLVFVAMVATGVSATRPTTADLLHWGAEFGPMTLAGQWGRLLTATFVHIGIIHLAYNMFAFAYVAPYVERMVGNVGFLLLYLVAGLGGSICALLWNPMLVHAGASGSVFGIYGALLALVLQQRSGIPEHVASRLERFVGVFVLYNLVYSLGPGISLAAHVGGVVTGFVCAFALGPPLAADALDARPRRNLAMAAIGAAMVIAGSLAAQSRFPNLAAVQDALVRFDALDARDATVFKDARRKSREYRADPADFADAIERDLLPEWSSTRSALLALKPIPALLERDVAAIVDYMRLREEGWIALSASLHSHNTVDTEQASKLLDRADGISREISRVPRARISTTPTPR